MGYCGKLTAVVLLLTTITLYLRLKSIFDPPEKPQVDDIWWGPGDPSKADTRIRPFKINIPDSILKDLENRLANHIPFHPPLEGVQQQYGLNTNLLSKIVDFWKNKYNWREREQFLNKFPHFKVNIQGLDIHYIHAKPKETKGIKVLPLLVLHGWPGSITEFYDIIPLLTTPQKGSKIAFEVIAPSLPGFGFSDGAVRPGLNCLHIGNIFNKLMKRIGFERYYIQGEDWGSIIVQLMATMYPKNVIGMHTNVCLVMSPLQMTKTFIGSFFPSLIGIPKEQESFLYPMSKHLEFLILEFGYLHLHSTKPDTVGVALRESPVGLAAYILEKFITWTNPEWKNLDDGGLTQKYTYTKLLDNIMIYWVSRSITTSMRLYAETNNKATSSLQLDSLPIEVPTGCGRFKHEMMRQPDVILKEKYLNLIQLTDYDGGHFPALEVPQVLAKDIFQFVEKVEAKKKNSKTEL